MRKPSKKITPKQARFADEYLIDLNAKQAAIRAGYSKKTADVIGAELLRKTLVAEVIHKKIEARTARTNITQDRVLRELARIAFADSRSIMSWSERGVCPIDSDILSDDDAAAVASVTETKTKDGGSMKVQMHDKMKALELIGKHLGLFPDKKILTGEDGKDLFKVYLDIDDSKV